MAQNQKKQAVTADQHEKNMEYKIGDEVWLSTKNIKTKKPSKKLDHKMIGPYKVKQLVGLSCQLDLSTSMKIHDVFHPSLLQKTLNDPLFDKHNALVPPVIVDNKEK